MVAHICNTGTWEAEAGGFYEFQDSLGSEYETLSLGKKVIMVIHAFDPSSQEAEAKDCHKFKASLVSNQVAG